MILQLAAVRAAVMLVLGLAAQSGADDAKKHGADFESIETGRLTPGEWHTLRLVAKGKHFEVSFDGEKLIEHDDETFREAGKVALWTKADSVTSFDDLAIEVM